MQLIVTGVDYSGNLIWREQFKISKRKLLLAYLSSEGMNDVHPVMYIWGLNGDGMRKACEKKLIYNRNYWRKVMQSPTPATLLKKDETTLMRMVDKG